MKVIVCSIIAAFLSGVLVAWALNSKQGGIADIAFVDHNQETFTLAAFRDKHVILNFMFNGCSPVQTVGLRRVFLDHELDAKPKNIVFVSISIAPETDTPAQLKRFAQRYKIDAAQWRFGITDRQNLDRLLETFNAGIAIDGDPNAHLNTVFHLDPSGEIAKVYTGFPINPDEVYNDLAGSLKLSSSLSF